jgi:hypothetical protein
MKTVLIDPSGKVVNEDRVVKVSKSGHEDVRWVAIGGGGPWTITFDKVTGPSSYPVAAGSPFTNTAYTVANGGSGGSTGGPVAGLVGWTYQYQVRAGYNDVNGTVTDDPDIDVET